MFVLESILVSNLYGPQHRAITALTASSNHFCVSRFGDVLEACYNLFFNL